MAHINAQLMQIPDPIFNFKDISIYKNSDNILILNRGQNSFEFNPLNIRSTILWLPLLELDFRFFIMELTSKLKMEPSLNDNVIDTLPIKEMIGVGLSSDSVYWVTLALTWLEKMPGKKTFEEALINISKDKKYSQSIRHKAMKYLKEIQRESNS